MMTLIPMDLRNFSRSLLRSANFLLQNEAILSNAAEMLNRGNT